MGLTVWNVIVFLLICTNVRQVIIWTIGNQDSTKSFDTRAYHCKCELPTSPSPSDGCIGAVYFATNDELGNHVVVNCIQSNGTLLFNNTISTHGNGSSDFLQYTLMNNLITGDNFLFVVNSGSDSVSMFSIDPESPQKLTFVTSENTQGDFPACLAYSSELKVLCVLNAGVVNNVACFKVIPSDLILLTNTIKSVGKSYPNPPPYAFDESVSDIIFTANSSQLIVSVKGKERLNVRGSIVVFPVLSQGKVLGDPVINNILHFYPEQLTLVPTTIDNCNKNQQNMIYSALTYDHNPGLGLFAVPPSGVIDMWSIVTIPIPNRLSPGWSKFSPRTGLLYTTDIFQPQLTETRIECLDDGRLNGSVVKQYPLVECLSDFVIVSLLSGDYLYAMDKVGTPSSGSAIIYVFALGNTPGNVTLIQRYIQDNDTIVAQTGQPLQDFSQGIVAFSSQPQSIGGGGNYHPL